MTHLSWQCRDPEVGSLLESYLQGGLDEPARATFEAHYFTCPGCLEEIRFRQSLASAVERRTSRSGSVPAVGSVAPNRRPVFWTLVASIALAAGVAAVVLLTPGRQPLPFELHLDGTLRGGSAEAQAPAGRPLDLSLLVPVPASDTVRYDVTVKDPNGTVVFSATGVEPTGRAEVRVRIPRDRVTPGTYTVLVRERGDTATTPLELRFAFVVPSSGPT